MELDDRERKVELDDRERKVEPEEKFWNDLIKRKLKPVSQKFQPNKDLHQSLESLRNYCLVLLLLVNLMWIVLLSSLTFWQLQQYNIDPRAFQLLFLVVYGIIIVIQFFTMLAHRVVTLVHYLGRAKPREVYIDTYASEFSESMFMSMSESMQLIDFA